MKNYVRLYPTSIGLTQVASDVSTWTPTFTLIPGKTYISFLKACLTGVIDQSWITGATYIGKALQNYMDVNYSHTCSSVIIMYKATSSTVKINITGYSGSLTMHTVYQLN